MSGARVASRHHHVCVDELGHATLNSLEHEHMVNRGRRHFHVATYDGVLAAELAAGRPRDAAVMRARALDGQPDTTLDLLALPSPIPYEEHAIPRVIYEPRSTPRSS